MKDDIVLKKVKSTNIQAVGWMEKYKYDEALYPRNTLRIKFINDSIYDFLGVSEKLFKALMESESKGEFFARKIKRKYKTIRRK